MEKENSSSSFAVVRLSGKQYELSPGKKITVDRLANQERGQTFVLTDVLMLSTAQKTVFGSPLVDGAKVRVKLLAHKRSKKVRIFKKKRRTGYTKRQGHRQEQSELLVEAIEVA